MRGAPAGRCGLALPKLGCGRTAKWGFPPMGEVPARVDHIGTQYEARRDVALDSNNREKENKVGFAAWVVLGVVAGWAVANLRDGSGPVRLSGALLTGVGGAVVVGGLGSLLGIGSANTFFSLGSWAAALAGAGVALATGAIPRRPGLGRSRAAS
jgi:hypothetical protein